MRTGTRTKGTVLERTVSIDIEVEGERIASSGGVRLDTGQNTTSKNKRGDDGIEALAQLGTGAEFVLGHNVEAHDLKEIKRHHPTSPLLALIPIDTLVLSPIAFAERPYHHLVKPYKEPALATLQDNDPLADARACATLLDDIVGALRTLEQKAPEHTRALHWLLTREGEVRGYDAVLRTVRGAAAPDDAAGREATQATLARYGCPSTAAALAGEGRGAGRALAWLLAWAAVAGGGSIIAPYIAHAEPRVARMAQRLRAEACADPTCAWCADRHDLDRQMRRWLGHPGLRASPTTREGVPAQGAVMRAHRAGRSVLAIMPTSAGKSACYQLPAVMAHEATSALTVVLSPLVSLMKDQVENMHRAGVTCAFTINSQVPPTERMRAEDAIESGEAGIVLIAPESLRTRRVRTLLKRRTVRAWIVDEGHCLSQWGHDFRPDYRAVAGGIRRISKGAARAPVLALTATARPEVIDEIRKHFNAELGIEMEVIDAGAERTNLDMRVEPKAGMTSERAALTHLRALWKVHPHGAAILYCTTRKGTESVAGRLTAAGIAAEAYHGGLARDVRTAVQERFMKGTTNVIAATKAFGMGVDKPDVRIVIHVEAPGSIEDHRQEAGRAGRDGLPSTCLLVYDGEDIERQLALIRDNEVGLRDVQGIDRAIKAKARKSRKGRRRRAKDAPPEAEREVAIVVTTTRALLASEEAENVFEDAPNDPEVRMRVALHQLESAALLTQGEHRSTAFPSALKARSADEARAKADGYARSKGFSPARRREMHRLIDAIVGAGPSEGVNADDLASRCGVRRGRLRALFATLEEAGVLANERAIVARADTGEEASSAERLEETSTTEEGLIAALEAMGAAQGQEGAAFEVNLRGCAERVRAHTGRPVTPEQTEQLARALARDGEQGEEDAGPGRGLSVHRSGIERLALERKRSWRAIARGAALRRRAAGVILEHILAEARKESADQGREITVRTSYGALIEAVGNDPTVRNAIKRAPREITDTAAIWLHENKVITIHEGLSIFQRAMTLEVEPGARAYEESDHKGLEIHYEHRIEQAHMLAEYARRAMDKPSEGERLVADYFALGAEAFAARWLAGRAEEIQRATLPRMYERIAGHLDNTAQRRIVTDTRKRTDALVLAGPGSGKTHTIVHRAAYLTKVLRVRPERIVVLCYNRHAALEIKRRLRALIGGEGARIRASTCHGFAFSVIGRDVSEARVRWTDAEFAAALREAAAVLESASAEEANAGRMKYDWILVDEYQDIGADEYALISALAGRRHTDATTRVRLLAVGDDDQNIYTFRGASVRYIRQFESDYTASKRHALLENYRSTRHIVRASETIIAGASERMKNGQAIGVDRKRRRDPPGGRFERLDPKGQGHVEIVVSQDRAHEAEQIIARIENLRALDPDTDWADYAIICRDWNDSGWVHALARERDIPVERADDGDCNVADTREGRALTEALDTGSVSARALGESAENAPGNRWGQLLREAVRTWREEEDDEATTAERFARWLREWGSKAGRTREGVLITSAHQAKGLEFTHVIVLDGAWLRTGPEKEDADAGRRLYYVAMTRAKETLALSEAGGDAARLLSALNGQAGISRTTAQPQRTGPASAVLRRYKLEEVYLSHASHAEAEDRKHRDIAEVSPGSALTLKRRKGAWRLVNAQGRTVGTMGLKFRPERGREAKEVRCWAVLVREKSTNTEHPPKVKRWESVIPEITWESAPQSARVHY